MYRKRLVCTVYAQMSITEDQTRCLMYIVDSFVMVFGETSTPRHKRGCLYRIQYLRAGLNKSINKGHKKKILAFSLF